MDTKLNTRLHTIAEEYVRKQLAVMDGSAKAGIRRIGTDRFSKIVADVEKTLAEMTQGRLSVP